MKKVIFGAACMISGLLLVLIMLFIGAFPNAFGSLNALGMILVWIGAMASAVGLILCLAFSGNKNESSNEKDE